VNVNTVPAITGTSFNPTSCASTTGKIIISGLTDGLSYTIKYSKNGAALTIVPNLISSGGAITISGLTAGDYNNITVTPALTGCSSNSVGPFTLSDPTPPATPVAAGNSPICSGTNLNLSASTIQGATYSWTGPNGYSSTLQNPIINAAAATASGTYFVTAKVNNCTSQPASVAVVINPTPAITAINVSSPVCDGNTVTLTATVSSATSFNWTGPNSFTSTLQNPVITSAGLSATGSYTLVAIAGTCSSTQSVSLTVNPVASITASTNNPTSCATSSGSIIISGLGSGNYKIT
jgi:hypothetical protein